MREKWLSALRIGGQIVALVYAVAAESLNLAGYTPPSWWSWHHTALAAFGLFGPLVLWTEWTQHRKIQQLESRELELVYEDSPSYVSNHEESRGAQIDGNPSPGRASVTDFYIGVRTTGQKTVKRARILLRRFSDQDDSNLPWPLDPKHIAGGSLTGIDAYFDVDTGAEPTQFVHLLTQDSSSDQIRLHYFGLGPRLVKAQDRTFVLEAVGEDAVTASSSFRLEITDGEPRFRQLLPIEVEEDKQYGTHYLNYSSRSKPLAKSIDKAIQKVLNYTAALFSWVLPVAQPEKLSPLGRLKRLGADVSHIPWRRAAWYLRLEGRWMLWVDRLIRSDTAFLEARSVRHLDDLKKLLSLRRDGRIPDHHWFNEADLRQARERKTISLKRLSIIAQRVKELENQAATSGDETYTRGLMALLIEYGLARKACERMVEATTLILDAELTSQMEGSQKQ